MVLVELDLCFKTDRTPIERRLAAFSSSSLLESLSFGIRFSYRFGRCAKSNQGIVDKIIKRGYEGFV